jgi:hypothetical protein
MNRKRELKNLEMKRVYGEPISGEILFLSGKILNYDECSKAGR